MQIKVKARENKENGVHLFVAITKYKAKPNISMKINCLHCIGGQIANFSSFYSFSFSFFLPLFPSLSFILRLCCSFCNFQFEKNPIRIGRRRKKNYRSGVFVQFALYGVLVCECVLVYVCVYWLCSVLIKNVVSSIW